MSLFASWDKSVVITWNTFIASHPLANSLAIGVGSYTIYLIPLVWIGWWFVAGKRQRELLLSAMLSGIVAWGGLNRIAKYFYFHPRPVHFLVLKEVLFQRPENSFPSDHAAFLSALAFFFLLQKQTKPGVWLLVTAVLVGMARIALAFHYPSDILAGLGIGLVAAWIVHLFHRYLSETVWEMALQLARKLHLA